MKRIKLFCFILVLVLFVPFLNFISAEESNTDQSNNLDGFKNFKAEEIKFFSVFSFEGRLTPLKSISYSSEIDGIVGEVYVRERQRIKKDNLLFTVERYDEFSSQYRPLTVRAYSEGIVTNLSIVRGQTIKAKDVALKVIDPTLYILTSYLSDKDCSKFKVVKEIKAFFDNKNAIDGTLYNLAAEPDYSSGLFKVSFLFRSISLIAGSYVKVFVEANEHKVLAVRKDALLGVYGQNAQIRVPDSTRARGYSLKDIVVNEYYGEFVEVLSGLSLHDTYYSR